MTRDVESEPSAFDRIMYAGAMIPKNEDDAGFEGYCERRATWLAALKWAKTMVNPCICVDALIKEIDKIERVK